MYPSFVFRQQLTTDVAGSIRSWGLVKCQLIWKHMIFAVTSRING